jgi:uncharacterized membrane protein
MNRHGHGASRGIPLHRIESFSDAVFAFAVTLLVVSLEVPHSAHDLFQTMHGFVAFGICFTFLAAFWYEHSWFFKTYPLNDPVTVALNVLLLFVLLLYVYPLKFLFTLLMDMAIWHLPNEGIQTLDEFHTLMEIYGLGFLALNVILLLMKINAKRHAAEMELNRSDMAILHGSMARNVANGSVAAVSVLIAAFTQDVGVFGGFIYALIGPLDWFIGMHTRRLVRKLGAEAA